MAEAIGALAAVGIASSILQIVDFASSVTKQTYRLVNSSEDTLRENIEVERLTQEYKLISEQICSSRRLVRPLKQNEAASFKLAEECRQESARLLNMLDDLKVQSHSRGRKRVLESARKSAKAVRLRTQIESRIKHLEKLDGQLAISLVQLLGYV